MPDGDNVELDMLKMPTFCIADDDKFDNDEDDNPIFS
jgi:hypothetical protein